MTTGLQCLPSYEYRTVKLLCIINTTNICQVAVLPRSNRSAIVPRRLRIDQPTSKQQILFGDRPDRQGTCIRVGNLHVADGHGWPLRR